MLAIFVAEIQVFANSARGAALGLDAAVIDRAFADELDANAVDYFSGPALCCSDLVDVTCADECDWTAAFDRPHSME